MPLVNIYTQGHLPGSLDVRNFKKFLAKKLTCGDIALKPAEISIRFLKVDGGEMIAGTEIEIAAHAFQERVESQDEICLDVMKYLKENADMDCKVWLKLSNLGHSW